MKKTSALLVAVFMLILSCLPVHASGALRTYGDVTVKIPENFTVYDPNSFSANSGESSQSTILEGLLFVATVGNTQNSEQQIQLRCVETPLSKKVLSFSKCSDESLHFAGSAIFGDSDFTTYKSGKTFYLRSTSQLGGDNWSVVYVTVEGGNLYTISYFGDDPVLGAEFVNSISFKDEPSGSSSLGVSGWLIVAVVFLFLVADIAFIIILIVSFLRDYRLKKLEQENNIVSQYIKIKRRKY